MLPRKRSRLSTSTFNKRRFSFVFSLPAYLKNNWFKLCLVLLSFFLFILGYRLSSIESINCVADGQVCPIELINLTTYLKGKNYFSLNQKNLLETISQIYPVDAVNYKYVWTQKIELSIKGWNKTYDIALLSVPEYPITTLELSKIASESSTWSKPSLEISSYLVDKSVNHGRLWANGHLTMDSNLMPVATLLYVQNLDQKDLSNLYQLIYLSQKYFSNYTIYVSNYQFLLSQTGRPDIIIYIPADIKHVETALQSIDYLYTINQDAKVIDLSFEHPIIK